MSDSTSTSAVLRVLVVPELVYLIINLLHSDRSALLACTRVNKIWNEESTRLLWARCGYESLVPYGQWNPPLICHLAVPNSQWDPPLIRHLADLAYDLPRLQRYANCIRELYFSVEDFFNIPFLPSDDSRDEARFHDTFKYIVFPRLEAIFSDTTVFGGHFSTTNSLLQYMQPNLQYINLGGGSLSDEFFITIQVGKNLHIHYSQSIRLSNM